VRARERRPQRRRVDPLSRCTAPAIRPWRGPRPSPAPPPGSPAHRLSCPRPSHRQHQTSPTMRIPSPSPPRPAAKPSPAIAILRKVGGATYTIQTVDVDTTAGWRNNSARRGPAVPAGHCAAVTPAAENHRHGRISPWWQDARRHPRRRARRHQGPDQSSTGETVWLMPAIGCRARMT